MMIYNQAFVDDLERRIATQVLRAMEAEAERDQLRAELSGLRSDRDDWRQVAESNARELARLTTWHPASEVPDTDRRVIVACKDWMEVGALDEFSRAVTHWRELPPGPEVMP